MHEISLVVLFDKSSDPFVRASNSSGFAALPGGNRDSDTGFFYDLPYYGYWWSTTVSTTDKAWCRYLQNNNTGIGRFGFDQQLGFCLRCLMD